MTYWGTVSSSIVEQVLQSVTIPESGNFDMPINALVSTPPTRPLATGLDSTDTGTINTINGNQDAASRVVHNMLISEKNNATWYVENWTNTSSWTTSSGFTRYSVSGGVGGGQGASYAINLAPGEKAIVRGYAQTTFGSGNGFSVGVSSSTAGTTPSFTDANGFAIQVLQGTVSAYMGSSVSGSAVGRTVASGATSGAYIFTIIIDETQVSISAMPVSAPQNVYNVSILRSQLPGDGSIPIIYVNAVANSAHYIGPLVIGKGTAQPPSEQSRRVISTTGSTPVTATLWNDSTLPTVFGLRNPSNGWRWIVRLPANYRPDRPHPVAVYMHEALYDSDAMFTVTRHTNMNQWWDKHGIIVIASDNGPIGDADGVGRPSSMTDYKDLINYCSARWNFGGIVPYGVSGGGYPAWLLTSFRDIGNIRGIALVCAGVDVVSLEADPTWTSQIRAAWGVANNTEFMAVVNTPPGYNAASKDALAFRNVPVYAKIATGDTVVPRTVHHNPMKTKLQNASVDFREFVLTSNTHLDVSLFSEDIANFIVEVASLGWTSATVHAWGAGGRGGTQGSGRSGGPGGGGAYASSTLSLRIGGIYPVTVAQGISAPSGSTTDTIFGSNLVLAKTGSNGQNGSSGSRGAAGAGGTTAASIGTTKYAGGTTVFGGGGYGPASGGAGGAGSGGAGGGGTGANARGSGPGGTGTYPGGAGGQGNVAEDASQPGNASPPGGGAAGTPGNTTLYSTSGRGEIIVNYTIVV